MPRLLCAVEDEVVIGRGQPPMWLPDESISRRHIRITREPNFCTVEDLGSKNGTFVNGAPLVRPTILGDQAVIRMGHTLLVFHPDIRPFEKEQEIPGAFGMAGQFHTGQLVFELELAAEDKMIQMVKEAYQNTGGNVSAIERELRKMGIASSRKKISAMLDRMGLNRPKRPRQR